MTKRTALLILNSEFTDPGIAKLPRVQTEMEALSNVLSSPQGGDFEVALLVNEKVQVLREQIVRLFKNRQDGDVLLVLYAGFALQDQFGGMYLAAADTQSEFLDATGLPLRLLRDQLDRTRSTHNLVILDCPTIASYSGAADILGSTSAVLSALEGDRHGRMVVAASDIVAGALEGEQVFGNAETSALGRLILTGLAEGKADLNSDGQINAEELYEFVYRQSLSEAPSMPMPRKFASSDFGPLRVARNPVLQPADLPDELKNALASSLPWMREGAIGELGRLLTSEDKSVSHAAHEALTSLSSDPTPQISASATAILQTYSATHGSIEIETPSVSQPPPPDSTRRSRMPVWGWVVVAVLLLFSAGVVAGLAGVFGSQSAAPVPTSTEESQPPTLPPNTPTAVAPPTAQPTVATEISLPSSLGMVLIPGGTYPIAEDRASSVGEYWIDRFEVSNGAFSEFLADAGQPSCTRGYLGPGTGILRVGGQAIANRGRMGSSSSRQECPVIPMG